MSVWGNILDRGAGKKRKENEIIFLDSAEIRPTELAEMMRKGIVHFQYRKKAKKGQPAESASGESLYCRYGQYGRNDVPLQQEGFGSRQYHRVLPCEPAPP